MALTRDRCELLQACRRMVFNVFAHNRDDHVKNFAFLMEPEGRYLVYSVGPHGEHSMMVGTEGGRPTYRNPLEVAQTSGIGADEVNAVVGEVVRAVAQWSRHARRFGAARDHREDP